MKHTSRQTSTATLTDLYRALDTQRPVTITYLKEEKDENGKTVKVTDENGNKTVKLVETVRTIEAYDIHTTKAGNVVIKAMDRDSQESRTFRLDRIRAYTLHRGTYQVERPAETRGPELRVTVNTPDEVVCRELARDDADYWNDRYAGADDYDHAA